MNLWSVPRTWPDETVFVVGGGPSLSGFDPSVLHHQKIIVVNNSYRLIPFADVLYFGDCRWFRWHKSEIANFRGKRVSTCNRAGPGVYIMKTTGNRGLEVKTTGLKFAGSGYAAVNLAIHFGAKRVVLLGFDMKPNEDGRHNWHEPHEARTRNDIYDRTMLPKFETMIDPLKELGVEVFNATVGSKLKVFPMVDLGDML